MFRKKIKITDIKIGKDRRRIRQETVKGLAASFEILGQLNPIHVDEFDNLITGGHRVEAAKLLGWTSIEAAVLEFEEDKAELAEIDENMQRANYDALEFSQQVARRKKCWERLKGKIKPGNPSFSSGKRNCAESAQLDEPTFTEDTAATFGVSKRTVQEAVAIGEKLTPEAEAIVKDTPVADNKTALAAIAAEPAKKQPAAARAAVKSKAKPKPKKNGAAKGWSSDKLVTDAYGKLVRLIDERAEKLGIHKNDPGYKGCLDALSTFLAKWETWKAKKAGAA